MVAVWKRSECCHSGARCCLASNRHQAVMSSQTRWAWRDDDDDGCACMPRVTCRTTEASSLRDACSAELGSGVSSRAGELNIHLPDQGGVHADGAALQHGDPHRPLHPREAAPSPAVALQGARCCATCPSRYRGVAQSWISHTGYSMLTKMQLNAWKTALAFTRVNAARI